MGVYGTPLVKVLFRTPLLLAHRTLYRLNARGGPSSRFSQFLELCVVTHNFRSTLVPDYPNIHVSGTCLVCIVSPLGHPITRTWEPDFSDVHVTGLPGLLYLPTG